MKKTAEKLIAFIKESPDAFHAAAAVSERLEEKGYQKLAEKDHWSLEAGKGYYVTRNESAVIAFRMPEKEITGYQIMASHSDSPAFKIKERPEMVIDGHYVKLNVEKYGGMICSTWLDRPLSVAGRVIVRTADGIATRLVNADRDLMIIPNLAIHMNRQVNDGYAFNPQKDMLPLFCEAAEKQVKGCFTELIAKEADVKAEDILDTDLFLYNRMRGTLLGADGEFLASPHLDDLQCAFSSLKGFLAAEPKDSVAVHCVYDNEEVGSGTKQGAESTFLKDVLHRINTGMGRTEEEYLTALASSFMVSADNAHAIHPNQPDKADPTSRPYLNQGIVIKYSANQKYCTDAVSAAVFKTICEKAEVPCQVFLNRSDILGGSTLGNISGTQVALNTVDIGLPQLAMHSSYETAGSRDTAYLIEAAKVLFSGSFAGKGDGSYKIG